MIAKMTITAPTFSARYSRYLCIGVAALGLCCVAWSTEAITAEPTATPSTTLQELTDRASEIVMRAMGMTGIHYKYGGSTPENGLDCSGLVRHVFKEAWGTILPRSSEEISLLGRQVAAQDLQPGDLVFYNTLQRRFSHVGIYLGDNKFIHAPSAGGEVRIESMEVGYWKKRFNGARRIADPEQR